MPTTTTVAASTAALLLLLLAPAASAFRPSHSQSPLASQRGGAAAVAFGHRLGPRQHRTLPLCTMSAVGDKPKAADAPGIGWDSHQPVTEAPESLVRGVEGNESMRRRFEQACRAAQVPFLFLFR